MTIKFLQIITRQRVDVFITVSSQGRWNIGTQNLKISPFLDPRIRVILSTNAYEFK
jgi:hypothetical protein